MSKDNSTNVVPSDAKREQPRESGRFGTKYQDNYPELLIKHMKEGFSFFSFGAVAMAGKSTLYDWLDTYPEFREAKEIGTMLSLNEWETVGKRGLHEITQKESDGSISKMKLNSTVYLANMRNRFGWDRPEKDNNVPSEIKIDIDQDDAKL